MREAHSTFVLKLVFLQRAGPDPTPLLAAQRATVVAAMESLAGEGTCDRRRARNPPAPPAGDHACALELHRRPDQRVRHAFPDGADARAAGWFGTVARRGRARRARLRARRRSGRRQGPRRPARAREVGGRQRLLGARARRRDRERDDHPPLRRSRAGGIIVATAHVDDPVVGEIADVAQSASPRRAVVSRSNG